MEEQQEKDYPGEMYDEEVYFYPVDEVIVEDCCPASVYKKIPCCEGTVMKYFNFQSQNILRSKVLRHHFYLSKVIIQVQTGLEYSVG